MRGHILNINPFVFSKGPESNIEVGCIISNAQYTHQETFYFPTFSNASHLIGLPRITELFDKVTKTTIDKNQVKLDAWHCKKFCIFVKRKWNRGARSRSENFQTLLDVFAGQEKCLRNIVQRF